jgi:hypothetical protein
MILHLRHQFFQSVRRAIGRILRAGLLATLVGLIVLEVAGFALEGSWPHRTFVHIAAVAFALAFGYAAAITTVLVEGARGMMAAAEFVEEEAKVAANAGINIFDAAVDAVDGPQRHGIR